RLTNMVLRGAVGILVVLAVIRLLWVRSLLRLVLIMLLEVGLLQILGSLDLLRLWGLVTLWLLGLYRGLIILLHLLDLGLEDAHGATDGTGRIRKLLRAEQNDDQQDDDGDFPRSKTHWCVTPNSRCTS